ncbi:PEP-CTERM sorting domain-containing protein [Roseomonas sp. AR75]|uniref:PEP-CTERM sorting domain-containing protein n=1 Tax=Roseomonas sp. AR75 TaxID=2562311 RepID=UPI0010BFF089|nr:PEP-CTERM sorting domain-containing protein [Roseomonas sp. AR75]
MSQIRIATFAAALGMLATVGTPAVAALITETPEQVLAAAVPAAEEDRIVLVSTSAEVGQMTTTSAAAVPAPAALALFGVGLLGLAAARRLRR